MSTYWDLYCKDCDSHLGMDHNQNRIETIALCNSRDELAEMAPLVRNMSASISVMDEWGRCSVNLEWFETHHNHKVVVRSEYGEIIEQE